MLGGIAAKVSIEYLFTKYFTIYYICLFIIMYTDSQSLRHIIINYKLYFPQS